MGGYEIEASVIVAGGSDVGDGVVVGGENHETNAIIVVGYDVSEVRVFCVPDIDTVTVTCNVPEEGGVVYGEVAGIPEGYAALEVGDVGAVLDGGAVGAAGGVGIDSYVGWVHIHVRSGYGVAGAV